jgi:hypothetical protein
VAVGGPQEAGPAFTDIVFSGGGKNGYLLPAGIEEAEASFSYDGMTADTPWSYVWYYEGQEIAGDDGRPFTRLSGNTSLSLPSDQGFAAGTYRLELYIEERLAATADFLVGGDSDGSQGLFGPLAFAEGVDRTGKPVNPGTSFRNGISELYAFFDYRGMQDGWEWTRRWSVDGEVATETDDAWADGESGEGFWVRLYSDEALPDGEYQLDLLVEGEPVQSGTCTVGSGRQPTPTPGPEGEVEVYGRITNATTGRGIAGAFFLVLQPGISVDDFQWTEEEVYSAAETDRSGNYELSVPLVRGETYSIIIGADGYNPIGEDDIHVAEDTESPLELNTTLQAVR